MSNDFGFGVEFDLPTVEESNAALEAGFAEVAAEQSNFWGNAFDPAEIAETLKKDLPPDGEYVSQGLTLTQRTNRFRGTPELYCFGRVVNPAGIATTVRFNLSPKKQYKENDPSKLEFDYVLYKKAVIAYKVTRGQGPTSAEEFEAFLAESGALKVRLLAKRDGSGVSVMDILGVRA